MALFNRSKKNQKSVLPDEVSQYYQSQRRERTGVALMLGIVALVVTLLIGSALFFGGRFVYRQFANDNKPAATQPVIDDTKSEENKGQVSEEQADNDASQDALPGAPETSTPGSGGADEEEVSQPTTTPSTGDATLPHTGDAGM